MTTIKRIEDLNDLDLTKKIMYTYERNDMYNNFKKEYDYEIERDYYSKHISELKIKNRRSIKNHELLNAEVFVYQCI